MATVASAPLPGVTPQPPYPQSPVLDQTMALVCLIINIFVPGIGTIAGGVMGQKPLIGRGIAQLLLTLILIGWIWGVVTGIQMLQNAVWNDKRAQVVAK